MDKATEIYFMQIHNCHVCAVHPITRIRGIKQRNGWILTKLWSHTLPTEHRSRFPQQGKMNKQRPWKRSRVLFLQDGFMCFTLFPI